MGAFVSFHRLEIGHVAHDGVFIKNTIRSVDISGHPSDFQSDVNVVHLGERDLFGEPRTVVLLLTQVIGQQLPLGDFTKHPSQLVLDQLVGSDGMVELDAGQSVSFGAVETGHGRTQSAP